MTYSNEIIAKAEAMKAKGSPLTIERICEIIAKQEAKDAKKTNSAKSEAKLKQREMVAEMSARFNSLSEGEQRNILNRVGEENKARAFAARPSSMR